MASDIAESQVQVNRFELVGNHVIETQVLEDLLSDFTGRQLTMTELNEATRSITAYYRSLGYWATAVLPEQSLGQDFVTIEVLEAKLGDLVIDSRGEKIRFDEKRIRGYLLNGQDDARILKSRSFEKAIKVVDSIPGISVAADMKAGKQAGETDLHVVVQNTPLASGSVVLDNFGTDSTGKNRISGNMIVDGLFRSGEQIGIQGLSASGSTSVSGGVTVPLSENGARFGVRGSSSTYSLQGKYASLKVKGWSSSVSAEITNIPLYYSDSNTIYGAFDVTRSYAKDEAIQIQLARKRLNKGTARVIGNVQDEWLGGGMSSWSLMYTRGFVNLGDDMANFAIDQAGPLTHGPYSKMNLSLSRLQYVTGDYSLWFAGQAQYAMKNLDSMESFALGGPSAVRAYDGNADSGDQGLLVTGEIRRLVNQDIDIAIFYDYGLTHVNKRAWTAALQASNLVTLQGVGVSVKYRPIKGMEFTAQYSYPIGKAPAATMQKNQLWLNLEVQY
jgi:hemolysin activation/secretion protein